MQFAANINQGTCLISLTSVQDLIAGNEVETLFNSLEKKIVQTLQRVSTTSNNNN